jgi:putative zinc finger protein
MDCREFRAKHVAFVDDTLSLVDMEAMQRHLRVCSQCARRDTAVRRSLLVVRNLPEIEPSADFMSRLNARLAECASTHATDRVFAPSIGAFATIAAGVALATYFALGVSARFEAPSEIRLAPVVASIPEPMPSPMNDPAFVASMSAGMPMWPAVLMMDQAPMHMANVELQQASLTR